MMIVSKNTDIMNVRSPLSPSALQRKDIRRGRQVLQYFVDGGAVIKGTIMSSPFDDSPKQPDRDTGHNVLIRTDSDNETRTYRLDTLGVVPDEDGEWICEQFLLDANKYDKLPQFNGSADVNDPPDRS